MRLSLLLVLVPLWLGSVVKSHTLASLQVTRGGGIACAVSQLFLIEVIGYRRDHAPSHPRESVWLRVGVICHREVWRRVCGGRDGFCCNEAWLQASYCPQDPLVKKLLATVSMDPTMLVDSHIVPLFVAAALCPCTRHVLNSKIRFLLWIVHCQGQWTGHELEKPPCEEFVRHKWVG